MICGVIYYVSFLIVRYDAVENYIFFIGRDKFEQPDAKKIMR